MIGKDTDLNRSESLFSVEVSFPQPVAVACKNLVNSDSTQDNFYHESHESTLLCVVRNRLNELVENDSFEDFHQSNVTDDRGSIEEKRFVRDDFGFVDWKNLPRVLLFSNVVSSHDS
jgi:hypothetical protein